MSWTYEQRTGRLYSPEKQLVAVGYSGAPDGKNRPDLQMIHNLGPIPQGRWVVGPPRDTIHSPYTLRLTPDDDTEVYGRGGFLIHGDSIYRPGTASLGCIILRRAVRIQIWESGDHVLDVVSGDEPTQVLAAATGAAKPSPT